MLVEALLSPSGGAQTLSFGQSQHRDKTSPSTTHFKISSFTYRAHNPVLVNRRQHLCGALVDDKEPDSRGKAVVWAEDDDGVVGMSGEVKF
jgi:G3E family GTPase